MKNDIYVKVVTLLLDLVQENGPHAEQAREILRQLSVEVA